ncbi:HD domain-containing protein [Clostridium ganghwense]|uniref:HD domain-containing protein n=1 Tax=Clostridium ganghwense TaxID=312089 RepID=A0ABT4CPN2_9CLOT|nr:HD domain-containing protein [Clostridium ganghwense]MCY6371014.1 HD domain-containing protein [Clostridium ganghwense]
MKNMFTEDLKSIDLEENQTIEISFMIMKILDREGENIIAYIGDKTGDIKASIRNIEDTLKVGDVINAKVRFDSRLSVIEEFTKEEEYEIEDFLPTVDADIKDIMEEIKKISDEEFKSEESRALNEYFFGNKEFVDKFKKGIGGLRQHHNYIGGLAEHTLNVMYITKTLAYRYDCRNKEIAILAAKLHDIGKIEEYFTNGPFDVTLRGDMEGHIVIGITMLEEAFQAGGDIYSEEFKSRMKGCIVQHHGKVEFGSPKAASLEESFILNLADSVDAVLNKIWQVKQITEPNTWSQYDRRIGTRLYL